MLRGSRTYSDIIWENGLPVAFSIISWYRVQPPPEYMNSRPGREMSLIGMVLTRGPPRMISLAVGTLEWSTYPGKPPWDIPEVWLMRCLRVIVRTMGAVDGSESKCFVMSSGRRSQILSSRERIPSSISFIRARPAVGLDMLQAWKRVSESSPTEEIQ